jgi:hypothetical protein
LQGLSKIMARSREKARLGLVRHIGLPLGRLKGVRGSPTIRYVGERYDYPLDGVFLRAIRQNAAAIVIAGMRLDLSLSTSVRVYRTVRASAKSAASAAKPFKSERGRPTSLGMTLKSALVAGVKNRMFNFGSRKSVATSVLYRTFCRRRRLGDRLAIPARELLAPVLDDLPASRLTFERLGDDLAKLAQPKTATFATSAGRGLDDAFNRQVIRQLAGTARRARAFFLRRGRRRDLGLRLFLGLGLLKIFNRQFKLLDKELAAFRGLSKVFAPRFGQQQFQAFDL